MEKLTELKIKSLKPTVKEKYIREGNGFVLRIRSSGSKSFYYIYDFAGKRRRLLLGSWPAVSLAEAREKHMKALLSVKKGEDPQSLPTPLTESDTKQLIITIDQLVTDYLKWSQQNHSASWYEIVRITINAHLTKPDVIDRDASNFKRRDALEMLDFVAVDRPGMARTLLRVARGVFGLAVELEKIEINPFAALKLARTIPTVVPKSRERVLTDCEIQHVWRTLNDPYNPPGTDSTRRALLLVLVTGQRPGEVAGMMYDEIVGNWWTIPEERTKNRISHRVYLSPLALTVVGVGKSGPVFAGRKGEALRATALPHLVAKGGCISRQSYFGLPRWTPHDLRRTAATKLSEIDCIDEHIDAILNHSKKGVIGIYNRYKYDKQKKKWLTEWAEHLSEIVT